MQKKDAVDFRLNFDREGLDEEPNQELIAWRRQQICKHMASIKLQLDVLDRSKDETAELAVKVLEFLQTLKQKWVAADYAPNADGSKSSV